MINFANLFQHYSAETSNASSYSGKRTLVLTEEQKELAATALQGENCVMVAPTGCPRYNYFLFLNLILYWRFWST